MLDRDTSVPSGTMASSLQDGFVALSQFLVWEQHQKVTRKNQIQVDLKQKFWVFLDFVCNKQNIWINLKQNVSFDFQIVQLLKKSTFNFFFLFKLRSTFK